MSKVKVKRPRICYLCTGSVPRKGRSAEHVIPKGLFNKEDRVDLITLPAHQSCNGSYAMDDQYFQLCLTSAAFSQDAAARTLFDGPVMRGFHNPDHSGLKRSVLSRLGKVPLQTPAGIYLGTADIVDVEADRLCRVVNRIARGLYAHKTGKALPVDWPVSSDLMRSAGAEVLPHHLGMRLTSVGNGTVFYAWGCLRGDDREGMFWLIFYRSVHFYAYTGTEIRSHLPW